MYKLCKDILTGKTIDGVIRATDGACIPFAEGNTDYQAYLKWLDEGNTPLPADDQTGQNAGNP
jgi:hypothetical protein